MSNAIKTENNGSAPELTPKITAEHSEAYSEDGFWQKIKTFAQKIGASGLYYALVLYYMWDDPKISATDKTLIIAALGYLILPVDLIPDVMPMIGFSDDISAMVMVLKKLKGSLTEEHREQATQKLREWFPTADPIDLSFL
jgi:uncharacterized membrane protein YkvA (DUF1232 family)